jgi:membrane fusion protein (multidrug efflux system)
LITDSRAVAVAGRANRLIMWGLTRPHEFAIVWYAYCTHRKGVGMCSRNILTESGVCLHGAESNGPRGLGLECRRHCGTFGTETRSMKKTIRTVFCLMLAGALLIQFGCGRGSGPHSNGDGEAALVPVEVAEVSRGDISAFFTGTATLEAEEETQVVAKVGGVVEQILVEEGDYVVAGQVLAKLDDEKLAVQVERTRANLQNLEEEYRRSEELFRGNMISAQEFQKAKYDFERQKAEHDLAKLDLEYTSIRSPISGVVAERLIKMGNMVLPNQATFSVTGMDPLLAVLHVPERQLGKLRVGHAASLEVDALAGAEYLGRIDRISPVVDPATGTVKVTVEVRDRRRSLKPGMFARVNIVHDVHAGALLVPKDAIIAEDRESSVFVVRDSTAYRQTVQTGYVNSSHIEVLSGVVEGDTVVTIGKGGLKDSTKVELVSGEPGARGKGRDKGTPEDAESAAEADSSGAGESEVPVADTTMADDGDSAEAELTEASSQ